MSRAATLFYRLLTPRGMLLPLTALCAVLGSVVAAELTSASDEPPLPGQRAATSAEPGPARAPATLPPLGTFPEVTQRPLFSENRRPAAAETTQSDDASQPLALAGIVIADGFRSSLFAVGDPPVLTRFKEGQTINGWMIRSIERNRVLLRRGDDVREVKFHDTAAPSSPPDNPKTRH